MEELRVVVNQRDAKRFLSKEDYETLELFEESRRRGRILLPWAEHEYYRLLDGLEDKKRMELVEAMFGEYEEKIKEDELRLKELSEGTFISTRQEALQFFFRDFPNYKRLLDRSNPSNWLPGYIPKIRNKAKGCIEGIFDYCLMEKVENPEAFGYEKKIWPFIVPRVNYVKVGLNCLEFSFTPYAVATSKVHRAEHKKTLKGWSYNYLSSDAPLYLCTEILDPSLLDTALPKITVPLKLLRGLASGYLEPDGCEVVKHKDDVLTYRVGGFNSEVVLPHDFVMFIMELGEDPLVALKDLGLLSEITLRILTSKKDVVPLELPVIREKDRKYLGIIHETEGFLTYGGWGEALELTRDGAYRTLTRLEEDGLVNTEKHESGEGTRASLTALGLAAIR